MKNSILKTHIILYVEDQERSTKFYSAVLEIKPRLNVPGMTEFELGDEIILGLMPYSSAEKLLGKNFKNKNLEKPIPKTELYLITDKPNTFHKRALENGAEEISPLLKRDWGHKAAYSIDFDGNILAFAEIIK
ncbi:MAG: glyoxalase [Ignavibacteriae bacterium]|nr:glyoxalase [Ignavibacteriota bacterium]NOG96822.1 glyoxalase [Ignavibacteriota bacterium]